MPHLLLNVELANFTTYYPTTDECATLAVGEHVCFSDGTLPDYSVYAYSTYLVVSGDDCSTLAATLRHHRCRYRKLQQ